VRWFDPKTKSGLREIPIPSELVAALKAWKEKCPSSRLELVFGNEFGEPCDRTGMGRYGLKPALEQAKIDKVVTMHGLRHTYASMLILLGRKIPEISQYLGHADVSITMRVYAHFVKPKTQDTMRIWKGSSKMARQKLLGTTWHSLTGREKNIIVSS
jgi:integrase